MKPKTLYLALCLAGVLLPYWQFLPWVLQHGLNLPYLRANFSLIASARSSAWTSSSQP